jgi:thiamine-monophosphate kinase
LGEHEALGRLRRVLPGAPDGEVWFGDDAAVVRPSPGSPLVLLTTDTVVAGIDADLALTSLSDLGWKAMAVSLSDIAAMGGAPAHSVVSVVGLGGAELELLYEGVLAAAAEYRCPVVGGDLSAGGAVVVTVAVTGSVPEGVPVLRRGARPGDAIWVTGPLGASAAGLRWLRQHGRLCAREPGAQEQLALVNAHARPRPALAAGTAARQAGATAMIDVSDGFLADVAGLADQSGVGFELTGVPVAPGASELEALEGGEDFVLVFTSAPGAGVQAVLRQFAAAGVPEPVLVGYCVADQGRRLLDGEKVQVKGWEHAI